SSTGLISMVDWDDATQGDPHFDLGRLIAHLVFLADELELEVELGSLLNGYCQGQGEICPARLRWHIAAAMLMRGRISLLRPLADNWHARLVKLVGVVESLLEPRYQQKTRCPVSSNGRHEARES
ncbi:MAG: phosphotransferase, partial [Actinomycetia bacterium]|nr:phosphotransferase [Actinomycetes bacterium]